MRLEGSILTPSGWIAGELLVADGRIAGTVGRPVGEEALQPPFILPGFIDCHVHGGAGADAMEGEAAVRKLAAFHASRGTVAMLPTTMTAKKAEIEAALAGIEAVRRRPGSGEAAVLGAHLEGPFINPCKLGAQPAEMLDPDPVLAAEWCRRFSIRVVTLAPERPNGEALVRLLAEAGVKPQIGHSLATADEARSALQAGIAGFTHLFNAMSGTDHRAPGVAAVALAEGESAELIADLHHVAPDMIRAAARAIPGLYAITDATSAAGMPDGQYRLGAQTIVKQGGRATLADGETLAGSVLTMDAALKNLVAIGFSLREASDMLSARPASYLGLEDLGAISEGAVASLVVLDEALALAEVFLAGVALDGTA
ncbi:N-acetylglucosamine-6-phosphate deacetylase [Afifella sp. IM 167]|uniref:N-acetylglucosamine-6-phosphate deacetylase n=1 Tax=Afifella sp. IM 167 TaxID=2033586 RepID=UPI001CCABB44|nr:N-acetylglucosamine-6-phosphate deacetylase [Afifella sp. IM 167]MBZ8132949.1 N-acetylglucosamine-6-phosphate deacetylase [Afifella sp. IM 167]